MAVLKNAVRHTIKLAERYPWAIPLFGFVSGIGSFLLVQRKQEEFSQILVILMMVSWVWLALEDLLQRGISHWFHIELPPAVLRFVTQLVHQESLFFVVPFFFITTSWNSGQTVFTSLLIAAAFISIIDPLYYKWLAPRRWLYFFFHGVSLFAVLLTALPLIFHLPTPQSYLLALLICILLTLPGITRHVTPIWWKRIPVAVLLMSIMGGIGYYARPWVPPASIWLTEVAITDHVNDDSRSPNKKLKTVSASQLHQGIYAYTSIHAPRGLHERIYHVWHHNGKEMDKIALDISGGREEGYRAWTNKKNFPAESNGHWQIHVITEAKQVIGVLRFEVVDSLTQEQSESIIKSESAEQKKSNNENRKSDAEKQATVSEEKAPVVEEKASVVGEKASVVGEKAPFVGEKAPVVEEAAPVAEEKSNSESQETPASEPSSELAPEGKASSTATSSESAPATTEN